ncbi:MAG: alpha-lytic protease prodomain-containing protein [Candidatus Izemoplasmatales bacterium]
MNKKLLILIALLLLLIFNGVIVNAYSNIEANLPSLESQIKNTENTNKAIQINNQIALKQSSLLPFLSENYAGVYLDDDDNIVLGIYASNQEDFDKLCDQFSIVLSSIIDSPDDYRYEFKTFSLSQLDELKNRLMSLSDSGITSISVDFSENKVKVVVESTEAKDNLSHFLSAVEPNFDYRMLDIKVGNSFKPLSYAYSGEQIKYRKKFLFIWYTQWYGSIGFNATLDGEKGLVTCSHVAPFDYTMFDKNNLYIGKASISIFEGSVDAAFIPFDDQNAWGVTNEIHQVGQTSGTYYIRWLDYVVEGSNVKTHGVTTNYQYGEVLSIDFSATVSDVDFDDLIQISIILEGGDSGGPLVRYYPRSVNYGLVGINFAGDGETSLSIKIDNIIDELGVEVVFD